MERNEVAIVKLARVAAAGAGVVVLLALAAVPAANYYYKSSRGAGCARCHEIGREYRTWQASSHRKVNCTECHTSSLATNLRRVAAHAR
ncbi:MAG: hypothetical protein M1436_04865, partial [Acidobacteria bacterium]|nr:hypothetical protein [Acidobacteriota bacterium]